MSFRSAYPVAAWLGILLLTFGTARAEDPFLGQIREIKCVNCKPGWVTLVVHDPIDTRDFELYLKDTDYNRIITPLPGKRIHDRNGECFYWMERPKGKGKVKPTSPPGTAASGTDQAVKPAGKSAPADSLTPVAGASAAAESALLVPPPMEEQGTPSTCIRFYKQMN